MATGVGGKNMLDYDPDLWDRVMTVNVKGTWLVTRAAVPLLREGAGIVNVASDTALWGAPRLMAYVASKGAVMAMTHAMAREMGGDNVTDKYPEKVNAFASSGGNLAYSTFSPYGYSGAFYYGKVAYNW